MKRIITIIISLLICIFALFPLSACNISIAIDENTVNTDINDNSGGDSDNERKDGKVNDKKKNKSNKVQIKIYSYNGGVGNEWLDGANISINGRSFKSIKEAFEEQYADYTNDAFPGKKGVELVITKDLIEGNTQFDSMASEEYEIYFSDKSKYTDMVKTGKVKDISKVYTESTYGIKGGNINADGSTILSNLTDAEKEYFGFSAGKYYALPHYSSYGGLNYNKNVFNKYKLYFGKGGCPSEFERSLSEVEGIAPSVSGSFVKEIHVNASGVDTEGDTVGLSAGPDGKYNTFDDGFPATYEDFFLLCDYMIGHNVIPFTWSDTYGIAYMNSLLGYLRADYEGKDQLRLFYDPDGFTNEAGETINTATNLVVFNDDNPSVDGINVDTEEVDMTNAKGYEMFRTAGVYYATYFLSQMMSDKSYLNQKSEGTSHTQAQEQFVKSEFYSGFSDADNPVAFLVEGNYWYNEAKLNGIFDQSNNDGKTTDYGLLPVPKVDASLIGTRTTLNIGLGNLVYVNANTSDDKMPLITEFLKFCYADERLSDFTAITGMPKGLNYDLGDKRDCLPSYYKSVWDLTYNSNTDVVYAVSNNACFLNTPAYFNDYPFRTTDQMYMLVEFTRNPSISASEVFKSLVSYRSQSAYNSEFLVVNGGRIN